VLSVKIEDQYWDGTDSDRVILMNYREDGVTPFVTVWKHGLTEMKV
jgi:hypothetical protein